MKINLPIGHSLQIKETYETMQTIFHKIKKIEHEWVISGCLNVLSMFFEQQVGNRKNLCFLYLWDSRAKQNYWINRKWPSGEVFSWEKKKLSKSSFTAIAPELSMGRLDQARTRKCKPESGPNP